MGVKEKSRPVMSRAAIRCDIGLGNIEVMRKIVVLLFLVTAACGGRASEGEWTWKLMKRCWQEGGSFHYWEEEDGKQTVFECHTHSPAKLMFRDVYTRTKVT